MGPWWKRALAIAFALSLGSLVLAPWALGVRHHAPRDVPRPASPEALEARWDALLAGAVSDGHVDYGALAARREGVADFVAALAEYGPETAPEDFESERVRFAYYLNAYNALVVFAVLENDVRRTVHEVRGPLEPVEGFGFFWAPRFRLDGAWINLYGLENERLRTRFDDARLHAAINCASVSCPALAEDAYRAATLEAQLDEAARRFTTAPHVAVDEGARVVTLSAIYDWYAEDFDGGALAWIAEHAAAPEAVERARRQGYDLRFAPYDWRLNGRW